MQRQAQSQDAFSSIAGEMAERVRGFDWNSTPLGPIGQWPQSLKSAVGFVLMSPVALVMLWGEDGIMIYNDAYAVFAGGRHPKLLGSKVREGWPEVADFNDNVMRVGLAGGTLAYRDQVLTLNRTGSPEEVWLDLDYSAIPDESGKPAGVLAIVVETTQRVLAERARDEQMQRQRRMFQQAPSFMAQLEGPEHIFAFANEAYRRLVGFRDVLGKSIREALPDLEGQGFYELLDRVFATGEPFVGRGVPVRLAPASDRPGGERLLDFIYQPVRDISGQVTGIFVDGYDVTEARRAEIALQQSEERLRLATENAEVGLWDIDAEENISFFYAGNAFSMPRDTKLPWSLFISHVHPEDASLVRSAYAAARDPDTRSLFEIEYRTLAMGTTPARWVAVKGRGVFDGKGRCVRMSGTAIDVTKRRQAEQKLRESEEQLRLATEHAEVGMWDVDHVTNTLYWPARVKAMFGISASEPVSMDHFYAGLHPEDRDRVGAAYAAAADPARRALYDVEYRTIGKNDGAVRWVHAKGRGIFDEHGFCLRVLGTAIDITARKLAEQQVRELNETLERRVAERTAALKRSEAQIRKTEQALQQAQKMEAIGNLTGGIAHDFNNLLQGVAGSLDLIRRRPDDIDRVRRWAEAGLHAAERGAKLTAQLLAFSRAQKLEMRPVNIRGLLLGMRELLNRTLGPNIRVRFDLDPHATTVMGDETQLELAVLNLSINARDAMPQGGDLVIAAREASGVEFGLPSGRFVELSVTDTGNGMDPEVASRAFDPFFTTKDVGKGTGLGLSQVYGMARQAGGLARIRSDAGRGTTVSVFLPLSEQAAQPSAAEDEDFPARGAPATVLIIDDDADVRRFLADSLDSLGFAVLQAQDGPDGLAMATRFSPDLVIVDYAMPGMTGAEVARKIRDTSPKLPIIFASGYADTSALDDVSAEVQVLRKPFRVGELHQAVRAALQT